MASATPHRRPTALLSALALVSTLAFSGVLNAPRAASDPTVHETRIAVPDGALAGGTTLPLEVTGGPELIAFTWQSAAPATFVVRAQDASGWSRWYTLDGDANEGTDGRGETGPPTGYAGPAFLGRDISRIEVRATAGDPPGVVVHAIDSEPVSSPEGVASADVATPPTIIPRSQWGADESWRDDSAGCSGQPDYNDSIKLGVVHHTDGRNDYTPSESASIIRAIYDFHVHTNGWCDVAYNFFIDRFGQTFEGRYGGIRKPVLSAATSGINYTSTSVAVLGDFTTAAVPQPAYDSLVRLLAFKLAYHGVNPQGSSSVTIGSETSSKWPEGTTVTLQNIEGHGDSNNTSCPGAMLEALLPQLRIDVANAIATYGLQPHFTLGRLSGTDRFATAAKIATTTFGSSSSAFLARGDGFADALSANYIAGHGPAPILLTNADAVPQPTMDALRSMGVTTLHLLGGTSSIGLGEETQLRLSGFAVDRISGADRYATAAAIAGTVGTAGVGTDDGGLKTAVLSSGESFADALSAGALVYGMHFPQLLAAPGQLPSVTAKALTDLGVQHVILTGGEASLSSAVETEIKALGISTERIAGATRYDTSVALADAAVDRFGYSPGHVDVATGESFPDALTGGSHAGRGKTLLVLSPKTNVPAAVCGLLGRRGPGVGSGHIFGGTSTVDSGAKATLEECLKPSPA